MAVPLCGDDLVTNLSMPNSRFRFKKNIFQFYYTIIPSAFAAVEQRFWSSRRTDRLFAEPALKNRKNARCVFTETFPGFPLFKAVSRITQRVSIIVLGVH